MCFLIVFLTSIGIPRGGNNTIQSKIAGKGKHVCTQTRKDTIWWNEVWFQYPHKRLKKILISCFALQCICCIASAYIDDKDDEAKKKTINDPTKTRIGGKYHRNANNKNIYMKDTQILNQQKKQRGLMSKQANITTRTCGSGIGWYPRNSRQATILSNQPWYCKQLTRYISTEKKVIDENVELEIWLSLIERREW